jgi:hypothetical protein
MTTVKELHEYDAKKLRSMIRASDTLNDLGGNFMSLHLEVALNEFHLDLKAALEKREALDRSTRVTDVAERPDE